jgi:Tfp pilus assembly PilM family ATPase
VDEVFIAGGASMTLGLDEILEKTVQKKVWKWNPAQYLELKMEDPDKEELIAHAASSAIALGLASRIRRD